jgi:TolB-like protein/Tfp pilus assembly protein PilF
MTQIADLNRRNVFRVRAAWVVISVLALVILMMAAERFWVAAPAGTGSGNQAAISTEPPVPDAPESLPAEPPDKSIAVLPFVNRSVSGENARFLSDGIHDDLLARLSRIHDLRVISRTSVLAYRDTARNMRQIGEELGVGKLLEGGVKRLGDQVRVDVRLIDANTGELLWAETYDRAATAEKLFEIQGHIGRAITGYLEAALTESESLELGTAPTQNLEAYQAVLISRQIARLSRFDAYERSADFARKAIRLDPAYADAHLALAFALTQGIDTGTWRDALVGGEIRQAIANAMVLKPDYAEAWSTLAHYQSVTRDPDADASFAKAMQLNPGNAQILYAYGYMLQGTGRPRQALPLLIRSSLLDPLSVSVLFAIGRTYDALEAFDEARSSYARIREIDPASPLGYAPNSDTYVPRGRLDEALYWIRRGLAVDPQDFEMGGWMVFLNDCLEDFDAAGAWSRWLEDRVTNQPQPMAMQAFHHYLMGNFEIALQYANLALRLGLENRWNSDSIFMRIKRDESLANGTPETGIEVFRKQHPQLFEKEPVITPDNLLQAVDLALLLKLTGRTNEMRVLLEAVISKYEQPWFTTGSVRSWLVPAKAQALAILGDDKGALAELRRVINGGWRVYWRWETDLNPNFNGIAQTREFRSMIAELEADMAVQRTKAQDMAARGEIPPPPETDRHKLL